MKGRTTIVIAHRMSTIEKCDVIYVLDNGRVKESGTFQELTSKQGGFFANMNAGKA
jgi:ATP-binding cassette subfamily B (MDR/TAP) protein 1